MCALLEERHWSFSGRNEGSRRTPTASILQEGTELLHRAGRLRAAGILRNKARLFALLRSDRLGRSQAIFKLVCVGAVPPLTPSAARAGIALEARSK